MTTRSRANTARGRRGTRRPTRDGLRGRGTEITASVRREGSASARRTRERSDRTSTAGERGMTTRSRATGTRPTRHEEADRDGLRGRGTEITASVRREGSASARRTRERSDRTSTAGERGMTTRSRATARGRRGTRRPTRGGLRGRGTGYYVKSWGGGGVGAGRSSVAVSAGSTVVSSKSAGSATLIEVGGGASTVSS